MAKQALRVHLLTMQRGDVHETRWKQLQVGLRDDNLTRLAAALEGLDAVEEELAVDSGVGPRAAHCGSASQIARGLAEFLKRAKRGVRGRHGGDSQCETEKLWPGGGEICQRLPQPHQIKTLS
jgi:hypothetical protein